MPDYTPPEPDAESDRFTLNYLSSRLVIDKPTGLFRIADGYQWEKPRLLRALEYCKQRGLTVKPGTYLPRPVRELTPALKLALEKAKAKKNVGAPA